MRANIEVLGRVVGLAMLLPFILCGCNQTQDQFHWKLQSQANESSVDYIELQRMAERIRVMSQGRLVITPHPGGALAKGPEIFRAVKEGRVEMGNGWPNWWSGQNPAWALMNSGPFDFMNLDASMQFFLAGPGTELANQLSMPEGVRWYPAWWPGMEFGLLSKAPILGLDDLKEKKVRIGPGLPSEVLAQASSAYTIPLVPEEIRPALEKDDIDAVEWTTTSGAWNLNLQDIARHAIVPAIWQPAVVSDFLINDAAFKALPADLQVILETAMEAYALNTTMKSKKADIQALEKFKSVQTQITKWSEEDLQRWKQATQYILESYSQSSDMNKRIIDAKQRYKEQYNEYMKWFGPYD